MTGWGALGVALFMLMAAMAAAEEETWVEPRTGMEFVRIAKACFKMGLPSGALPDETGIVRQRLEAEMPQHEVCLDEYWIGRHEVTEAAWWTVMEGGDAEARQSRLPMTGIDWSQAREFARRLSSLSVPARFRLPTEAEWEHACRAGGPPVTKRVLYGPELSPFAWHSAAYLDTAHGARIQVVQPVGVKAPNAFGLHDVLGNAWEWVEDSYDRRGYARHGLYNPVVEQEGTPRVIRGGGIRSSRLIVRCESRGWMPADQTETTLGFRLVMLK